MKYPFTRVVPVIVVAVIALAVLGVYFFYSPAVENFGTKFPDYFPKEMIADPYIVDLDINDSALQIENERHRVLVSYKSHRSLEDNLQEFKSYFETNNFSLIDIPASIPDQMFLAAKKDKISIGVTFWKRSPLEIAIIYTITK